MSDLTSAEFKALADACKLAPHHLRDAKDFALVCAVLDNRDLLVRALRAFEELKKLHMPFAIYSECPCDDPEHGGRESIEIGNGDFWTCNDPDFYICEECCCCGEDMSEHCAEDHDHGKDKPICMTRAILESHE